MIRPRPSTSQSGPPKIIASVKPQNAVPSIQPSCSLLRWKAVAQGPIAAPRSAKLMAVTTSATRLAANRREAFVVMAGQYWKVWRKRTLTGMFCNGAAVSSSMK